MHRPSVPIPPQSLYVGMPVHLYGTRLGCVWHITRIELNDKGELWLWVRTPVSGKYVHANASRARYIRAQEPQRRY